MDKLTEPFKLEIESIPATSEPLELFKIPEGVTPVVLLSGGRTSGLMLRKLLDLYPDFRRKFLVCFGNTGKEMPKTLDFLHEIESKWDIEIIWLEYTRRAASQIKPGIFPTARRNENLADAAARGINVHWFKRVDYHTADRTGKPFEEMLSWASTLPNQGARMCSVQLKIRTVMRYLFSIGLKEYAPIIGIRKDEVHRVTEILASADSFEHCQFPLAKWGITVLDVKAFWKSNDFDLGLEDWEGNCDFCMLKKLWKRVKMCREHPERQPWWAKQEAIAKAKGFGTGAYFRLGQPMSMLPELASKHGWITGLDDREPEIACSCAERGFEKSDEV